MGALEHSGVTTTKSLRADSDCDGTAGGGWGVMEEAKWAKAAVEEEPGSPAGGGGVRKVMRSQERKSERKVR